MPTPYNNLKRYSKQLSRDLTKFPCPQCGMDLLPKHYESHCTQNHAMNAKLQCVWCLGNVSWKSGQKNDQVDHLLQCWRKFMLLHNRPPVPVIPFPTTLIPFDMQPMCEPRMFFNHTQIPDLPERAFEPIWPMSLDKMVQFFKDPYLNLAATYVKRYLEPGNVVWYHGMVRAVALPSFLEAIDADEGRTQTLLFSSWCDGGEYPLAKHRQHLHFIMVATEYFMQYLWKKINTTDRPCRNFKCIRSKRIVSAMHLVNAIGYLSQRKSRCNFSFEEEDSKGNLNHFYIYSPLPADFRFALVTQWDGGLLELVHQEYSHMDPNKLLQVPMTFSQGKWHIQIKHLPGIRLNLALPLCFQLSTEPTPIKLHLAQGKKLYFTEATETSTQVPVYHVVGEEWWTPCPYQQKCLNKMKPALERIAEMETENVSLVWKLESLEWKVANLETEKASLEKKLESCQQKMADLETENAYLKGKVDSIQEENRSLLKVVIQMKDDEINRLKAENEGLKTQLERVQGL